MPDDHLLFFGERGKVDLVVWGKTLISQFDEGSAILFLAPCRDLEFVPTTYD